jgi:hypothetical protein
MSGLGFVSCVGEGLIRLGGTPDGPHGGNGCHGGADARHAQALPPLFTEKEGRHVVGLGCATAALGLQCTVMHFLFFYSFIYCFVFSFATKEFCKICNSRQ